MGKLKINVSLTILGSCDIEMKVELLNIASKNKVCKAQINFLDPVSPSQIFSIAARHHIGLALESETTINRDICLTNKIFTYMLSGLAIIATDTSAQKLLIDKNKGIGKYYQKGNIRELVDLIVEYQSNPQKLKETCTNSLKLASEKFNWEEDQKTMLSLIEKQFS